MNIKKVAYEKYKLDWMLSHGYTLKDLVSELSYYIEESNEDCATVFDVWESDYGFNGEIWVCYEEFLDNEYQDKEYMQTILSDTEFKQYCEEESNMSRVNNIAKFAQKRDEEKVAKEVALMQRIEDYKKQIRALKPRIDELLEVGNACLEHGIELTGKAWGGHEGYDTHQFISNGWSHITGFIREYDQTTRKTLPFTKVGKIGGGACDWNLTTDGVKINVSGDISYILKRFLDEFDEFETEFYKYVDKVTQ